MKQLLKAIDENPDDKMYLGVLADFLEDNADIRSEGIRWLIRENRSVRYYSCFRNATWWHPKGFYNETYKNAHSMLPAKLWELVTPELEFQRGWRAKSVPWVN
jgi:hypothetical protein